MLFFILGLILTLVSVIVSRYADKHDLTGLGCFSTVVAVFTFLATAIVGISLIGIKTDFKQFEFRYETTKTLITNYSPSDYGNQSALLVEIIDINKEIAKHRAKWDNLWLKSWYSKEIADLDYLVLPVANANAGPADNNTPLKE